MIKVKASLVFKKNGKMPTDIMLDIPSEDCNRKKWNSYIKEALLLLFSDATKVKYEVVEDCK